MTLTYNENQNGNITNYETETKFLYKINNILQTKKEIRLITLTHNQGLAQTDMKHIYLNFDRIRKNTNNEYFSFLAHLKGFNYHELSHILFTKYSRTTVPNSCHQTLNMLEDQRIENMFTQKYDKAKNYFRLLILNFILKNGLIADHYPLIYGRRLIINDNTIVNNIKKLFMINYNADITRQTEKIIDEYLITLDPKRQGELAMLLQNLLKKEINGASETPLMAKEEKKSSTKEEKTLCENLKDDLKNENKNDTDENNDCDTITKIEDKIEETNNEIETEIDNHMIAMNKDDFGEPISANTANLIFNPEKKHVEMAKRLTMQIRKIKNDLDNKTVYAQKHGRIDIRHAMRNKKDNLKDFKRFIPERLSKTRLGVSILVDSSGSMSDIEFNTAIGACWSITAALENTNSKTKVYEFSTDYRIIKDFDNISRNSDWGRKYENNTHLLKCLIDAKNSLEKLTKIDKINNNVIIIITDGIYNDAIITNNLVKKIKDSGVYIVLINIAPNNNRWMLSRSEYYSKTILLNNFLGLEKNMEEIIKHMQTQSIKKLNMCGE